MNVPHQLSLMFWLTLRERSLKVTGRPQENALRWFQRSVKVTFPECYRVLKCVINHWAYLLIQRKTTVLISMSNPQIKWPFRTTLPEPQNIGGWSRTARLHSSITRLWHPPLPRTTWRKSSVTSWHIMYVWWHQHMERASLWEESIANRFPSHRVSNDIWYFLWCKSEQAVEQTVKMLDLKHLNRCMTSISWTRRSHL